MIILNKIKSLIIGLSLIGLTANAHFPGENVSPLGDSASEEQIQIVRDGAKSMCEEKEDDDREECVMDFYANHNLEEEPSCD